MGDESLILVYILMNVFFLELFLGLYPLVVARPRVNRHI